MSDINGGFNKTAKELQDFVLNQARIADRERFKQVMITDCWFKLSAGCLGRATTTLWSMNL